MNKEIVSCYPVDKLVDLDDKQRKMSSEVKVYKDGKLIRIEESVKPRLKKGPWTLNRERR